MTYLLTQEEFDALKADTSKFRKDFCQQARHAYAEELSKLIKDAPHYYNPQIFAEQIKLALGRAEKTIEAIK